MLYSHLYSWRNLCEYLNSRWYKFAEPYEIAAYCKKCLPSLYGVNRVHRQALFETYSIQFIHWCKVHPVLRHYSSKSYYREFKDVQGWQMVSDWETKIDYLEQIVFFNKEPSIKTWEPALKSRIKARAERQAKIDLRQELLSLKEESRKAKASKLNICWQCLDPIEFLMVDCVRCGAVN